MAVIGLCCIMGQSFQKPTEKVSASAIKVPSSNIEFTTPSNAKYTAKQINKILNHGFPISETAIPAKFYVVKDKQTNVEYIMTISQTRPGYIVASISPRLQQDGKPVVDNAK